MRTDAVDGTPVAIAEGSRITPVEVRPTDDADDTNWHALRDTWRRNTLRLEYVIDQIGDGRRKIAFDRLPRTNYERIINKLQGQRLISAAAANASRSLNDEFNRYRPRNRAVPDEVVNGLRVLDHQLDKELVPFSTVLAADEDDRPAIRPTLRRPSISPMDPMLHPDSTPGNGSDLRGQSGS